MRDRHRPHAYSFCVVDSTVGLGLCEGGHFVRHGWGRRDNVQHGHDETFRVEPLEDAVLSRRILAAASGVVGRDAVRRFEIGRSRFGYVLRIHCILPGNLSVRQAHTRTAEVERAVREALPDAYRVTVHPEPG